MIAPERIPLDQGQLVVVGIHHQERLRWYRAQVSLREHDLVWIASPIEDEPAQPVEGAEVLLDTWRLTDARYHLRTEVVEVEAGPRIRLGLRIVEGLRIQRREYFRVPVSLTSEAVLLERDGGERKLSLTVRDLSAGGLRARSLSGLRAASSAPLATGDRLRIQLALPGLAEPLDLAARVTRASEEQGAAGYSCEIGAAFVDISPAAREQLIQFALSVQFDQLRRRRF